MIVAPLLAAVTLERISFWSDRAGDPDVLTMSVDGSDVRNLGTRNWGDKRASWSPDGEQIAYDSWYVGHREFDIWVMDANGGNKRQLTKSPLLDVQPAWSPDARWIAFTRRPSGPGREDIWVIRPDGSGERRVVRNAGSCAWSPDSRRLVYSRGGHLYTIGVDGRAPRRLTRSRSGDYATAGSWSPDGARILFTRYPIGGFGDVYVLRVRTGKVRRLTSGRADDAEPSWSPDGRRIVFDSTRTGNRDVFVMNADGSGVRNISRSPADDWADTWR
jgi:Tol biopolymer transport system component